jgi:hypothetical protein
MLPVPRPGLHNQHLASEGRKQRPINRVLVQHFSERASASLRGAIKNARDQRGSERLKSIRNLRDKHIAHYLSETMQEKNGIIERMKVGDERAVLDASIPIVEALNSWVNDVALPLRESQAIDRKCAEALWQACTFKIAAG